VLLPWVGVPFSIFLVCLGACRPLFSVIVLVSTVCLFYMDIRILITEAIKMLLTTNLLLMCKTKDWFSAIFALFPFVLEIKLTLSFEFNSIHVSTNSIHVSTNSIHVSKNQLGASSFLISTLLFSNFLQVNTKILDITFSPFVLLNLFLPSFRLCSFDK